MAKRYFPREPRIGDLLEVVFDDHAAGSNEPIECIVYGKLRNKTKKSLIVDSWICTDDIDNLVNTDRYAIVRSTIVSCFVLERKVS